MSNNNMLSIPQAAEYLGVSISTLRRYMWKDKRKGRRKYEQLPYWQVGKKILLNPKHLDEWAKKHYK